jgi:deoxycytidylate deaminase
MSTISDTIRNNLRIQADKSTLQQHLAAAVVHGGTQVSNGTNVDRNFVRGHLVPSLHAETRALLLYYGKNIYYNNYKGWCFYDASYKAKKVDIAVLRVKRSGELANARPCRKCLKMMRDLGVKKVHYSTGNDEEILCENVNDMFSIQDSSAARMFERAKYNYPRSDKDYYKLILKNSVPTQIKNSNLQHFIRFNLTDLLPSCSYSFHKGVGKKKHKEYIRIEDGTDSDFIILINIV